MNALARAQSFASGNRSVHGRLEWHVGSEHQQPQRQTRCECRAGRVAQFALCQLRNGPRINAHFELHLAAHAFRDTEDLVIRLHIVRFSASEETGMQSVRVTTPRSVLKRVSRTFVSVTYARSTCAAPVGARRQLPASSSSSAPKIEGLSNRGQQSQSIEPSHPTSAIERQSPIAP